MSEHVAPDWSLLPHEPEQFFGLAEGYDLKDLKRAYNQLVRQFKPEKFPAEFQRIRSAYEMLSDAVRYNFRAPGGSTPSPAELAALRESIELPPAPTRAPQQPVDAQPTASRSSPPAPASRSIPLCERVATQSPAELYTELKSRRDKSAQDYVALALLSDAAGEARTANESFAAWLLTGLRQHSHDWGLILLFREYVSELTSPEKIAKLLTTCVEVLPADRFQFTTERAWDRLLREGTLEQFHDCLAGCGQRLGRAADHSQLVFYIHVLKRAMWKADDAMIREFCESIEAHFHSLEGWAQIEYEKVDALLKYRAQRAAFVQRGPACQRIDQAIQDWCVLGETAGDQSVVDCQYFISHRGHRLLEEFPDFSTNLLSEVLMPWEMIVADVQERLDEPQVPSDEMLVKYAKDALARMNRRHKRTANHYYGLFGMLLAIALLLISVMAGSSFLVRMFIRLIGQGDWLGAIIDLALSIVILIGGAIGVAIFYLGGRIVSHINYATMRRDLIQLVRVAPISIARLSILITALEDAKYGDDETIDDTTAIVRHLVDDAAIRLFSLAQICLASAEQEPIVEAALV